MSFGNSRLNLAVAIKDCSMAGGVSSKFKTVLVTFTLSKLCFSVFGAKNSPVRLLVSDCQFLQSKKSKSVLPDFEYL